MRTTITFDPDVAALVEQAQRERGQGVSAVVNDLLRQSAVRKPERRPYVLRARPIGIEIDLTDVQDALDAVEGADRRW